MKSILSTVAAVILMCAGSPTQAQTPAAERFHTALRVITERLGPPQAYQVAPLKSDTQMAASLSDVGDSMEVFGTDAFPVDGFDSFGSVCLPLGVLPNQYLNSGLGDVARALGKDLGDPDDFAVLWELPVVDNLSRRNAVTYQDEMALFLSSTVKCMAVHMPEATKLWLGFSPQERTPERLAALRSLRKAVAANLRMSIFVALNPELSMTNRKKMLASVHIHIDTLAGVLTLADRKQLLSSIIAPGPLFKQDFPNEYATVAKALNATECKDLCLVP